MQKQYTRAEINKMRGQLKARKRSVAMANRYKKRQIVYERRYQDELGRWYKTNFGL